MDSFHRKYNFNEEEKKLWICFREYAKFYELPEGVELSEITEKIVTSRYVTERQKEKIVRFNRRFFAFTYPSDGLKVKGVISFVPDCHNYPLITLLRGGTGTFGILNPGSDLMCPDKYSVISTMYRGGVSEGKDEYGGDDVNDVKNLIDFVPELERRLGIKVESRERYLVGSSRGGMQMFLTLARFPKLQASFSKIVSLSGLLDMRECIAARPDLKRLFVEEFGLKIGVNEEEWIKRRDPLLTVDQIKADFPILILQGAMDKRISLKQGHNMVSQLQAAGKSVTYLEFEDGNHCLSSRMDRTDLILDWFR